MIAFDEISQRISDAKPCGNSIRGTCPLCDGRGTLSLTKFPDGGACIKCFRCDAPMRDLLAALGAQAPTNRARVVLHEVDSVTKAADARRLWNSVKAIEGTMADRYLRFRMITGDIPVTLRSGYITHPTAQRGFWAMVAAITTPNRQIVGSHITFVENDRKVNIEPCRIIRGIARGGAVHLAPIIDGTLALSEGVETGLSFQILWNIPTWACLSTSGLKTVELPPDIERVVIAADNDANSRGQAAAAEAADRIEELHGIDVEIMMSPEPGTDWNDILVRQYS
jgi:putative DNA primase/helicase